MEDKLVEIIKYMNEKHADMHGVDKKAILVTAASYFEAITTAEATKEAMIRAFKKI